MCIIYCTALQMQYYPCEVQPADMLTRAFLTFQMPAMSSLLFQSTVQCILIPCVENQIKTKNNPNKLMFSPSLPLSLGSSRLQGPGCDMFIKTSNLFIIKFQLFYCHRVCKKRIRVLVRAIPMLEHK